MLNDFTAAERVYIACGYTDIRKGIDGLATCGTDCPIQARTICTDGLRMLYLSQQGIGLYDGSQARLLARDALEKTLRLRDARMADKATACVCGHVYHLALCLKESAGDEPQENNAAVEYDMERGTFMLRRGLRVKDFWRAGILHTGGRAVSGDALCRPGQRRLPRGDNDVPVGDGVA